MPGQAIGRCMSSTASGGRVRLHIMPQTRCRQCRAQHWARFEAPSPKGPCTCGTAAEKRDSVCGAIASHKIDKSFSSKVIHCCNDSCSVLQYASLIDCASSMLASLGEHLMLCTEYHRGSIPLEMALQFLSYHAAEM